MPQNIVCVPLRSMPCVTIYTKYRVQTVTRKERFCKLDHTSADYGPYFHSSNNRTRILVVGAIGIAKTALEVTNHKTENVNIKWIYEARR